MAHHAEPSFPSDFFNLTSPLFNTLVIQNGRGLNEDSWVEKAWTFAQPTSATL